MKTKTKTAAPNKALPVMGLTLVNPKKQFDVITSDFASDEDAAARLLERIESGEFGQPGSKDHTFASDMYGYATGPGFLSDGRRFWLHKLATCGSNKSGQPTATYNLAGVLTLLRNAAKHLKFPALLATTAKDKADLGKVPVFKISLAGAKSKNPGAVYIASKEYHGPYYGKVMPDGGFHPGRDFTPEVGELLEELASKPAEVAGRMGKIMGKCCFCNLPLTDARSTEVGYGETCARHYGLPWGAKVKAVTQAKAAPSRPRRVIRAA